MVGSAKVFYEKVAGFLSAKDRSPEAREEYSNFLREYWRQNSERGYILFTLTATNQCTLRCDHCFEDAGPEKWDFLDADRIKELAGDCKEVFRAYPEILIRVTGGDPFLHPQWRKLVEPFGTMREELGNSLEMETNGWWAVNDTTTRDILFDVKRWGVKLLSMTNDYYHRLDSPFDNGGHFMRNSRLADEVGLSFRGIKTGGLSLKGDIEAILPTVTPIGRGRFIPEERWGLHACNAIGCRLTPPTESIAPASCRQNDGIMVGVDGNVYPCYSGKQFEDATLALGNIYENSLSEILSLRNPLVEVLRSEGLRGLSRRLGMSIGEHYELYDRFTPCGMCHKLLRERGRELMENFSPASAVSRGEVRKQRRPRGVSLSPG